MIDPQNNFLIIHYGEIGLKKGNRGFFEAKLRDNIHKALVDIPGANVSMDYGRFICMVRNDADIETVKRRLENVFGIVHFAVVYQGDPDVHVLKQQIFEKIQGIEFKTFRVQTRRADKIYPLTSVDVNKIVGERIFTGMNRRVDLKNAEFTVNIEIFNKKLFYSFEKNSGPGGLPVGTSAKVVTMLSSGIDSPVAAYRIMSRGCKNIFVHFHSFPFTEKTSHYNAIALARHLTQYQYQSKIYSVPLAEIQKAIILAAPTKLRVILYRRMMFRIAEQIARREKAKALVTGESLAQVASQTIENITAISEVVTYPVLRPLIGMDKEEIVKTAQKIGTFEMSIEPYDDCCSYLVPPNPETKAKLYQVHAAEQKIENWEQLLKDAIYNSEFETLRFPES